MEQVALLKAVNIAKSYAGVHALRDASFELRTGEVHALVGENGAGKSTLIKVLTGAVIPDSGEISLDGARITENSPPNSTNASAMAGCRPIASHAASRASSSWTAAPRRRRGASSGRT